MYYFCLYIILILSSLGVIVFFPYYEDSLFPLFLDIQTVFMFIPLYSILFFGVFFHLIKKNLKKSNLFKNTLVNKYILFIYCFISFIVLFYIQDFYSFKIKIFLGMIGIIIGFLINVVLDILSCKR